MDLFWVFVIIFVISAMVRAGLDELDERAKKKEQNKKG
jgi:hypothetical protein